MKTFEEMLMSASTVAASISSVPSEYWKIPDIVGKCTEKYYVDAYNIWHKKQREAEEEIFSMILENLLQEKADKA